jgi:flagellar motor switch protein FliM
VPVVRTHRHLLDRTGRTCTVRQAAASAGSPQREPSLQLEEARMASTSEPNASETGGPKQSKRKRGEPRAFDFRRQSKLSREHVRTMQIVQETFARSLSTMLASHLRSVTSVSIQSIDQHSYDEYVRELPNPTVLNILSLAPLQGAAILQWPLDVAYVAVELMLGGHGYEEQPNRPLSELEAILVRGIFEQALPELRYAFEPVVQTEPKIVSTESNPQYAQIAAPTDMVIVVAFEVKIEGISGTATLCIPFSSLQPHLEALSATSLYASQSVTNAEETADRLRYHLGETPVTVSAQFRPVEMAASDIVRLRVGDVLPLNHPIDQPLTLVVDDTPTFEARIGRRNRRLAVQVAGPADPGAPTRRPTYYALDASSS